MVMNDLFAQVLDNKDLSKAGDLFSLEDQHIVDSLSDVLRKIQSIAEEETYVHNDNDQSVVEICITRVTTAIRETGSIDQHAKALVDLLESCLRFDLEPSHKLDDPPHTKIASDIVTCLFAHYSKPKVMELVMPAVTKFINCSNKELSRNVSSFLSLAAISNSELMAKYSGSILDSILKGNTYLARVLPQLQTSSKSLIEERLSDLVGVLEQCDQMEKSSLLETIAFISQSNPQAVEAHLDLLSQYLLPHVFSPYTLRIMANIATHNSSAIEPYLAQIKQICESHPPFMGPLVQLMGLYGCSSEPRALESANYLLSLVATAESTMQICLLQEVRSLAFTHHGVLMAILPQLDALSDTNLTSVRLTVQQLRDDYEKYFVDAEMRSVSSQTDPNVTIITIPGATTRTSPTHEHDSLQSDQIMLQGSPVSDRQFGFTEGSPTSKQRSVGTMPDDKMQLSDTPEVASLPQTPTDVLPDAVQQFCEKRLQTIKAYIKQLSSTLPIPTKCCVVNGKHKRFLRLSFHCSVQSDQCIYSSTFFTLRTKLPSTWLHLMFLNVQAKSSMGLGQTNASIISLKSCFDALHTDHSVSSFITLTTSAFPMEKDKESLIQELHAARFFDVFELQSTSENWSCFVCNHPEKVTSLLQDGSPSISGQLKEKKGRWKFLKRWKTRYFTLSGSQITYNKSDSKKETLPISKIQSVKAVRKGGRDIPKAFEIFTDDQTYVLKARDQQNAEQWLQCLQIAMARSQESSDK